MTDLPDDATLTAPDEPPDSRSRKDRGGRLRPGDYIGAYRLQQRLGEGGMGEVWRAAQEEPVRRTVAVKLIKWGMDTRAVIARFESERQALALMDHPSIASVLDAGATEQGRPYFVMELVQGEPITTYCDRHRLSTEQRLHLFREVCEGVQHAHQKGIIHRDLKPSNVLVTLVGDRPVPKIIDFGVAKATAQRLTEQTLFTQLGQWVGTPAYMSPEQAEMGGLDIDTRSDVYSLGVMLYELLVGALPIDPAELRRAAIDEVRRKIRDTDPPRPSTRFSTLVGSENIDADELARLRSTAPQTLARSLRGDLDWITLKALEKDRTRRYASPHELAEDIARSLRDEPVLASPPSAAYRARKFAKRHRFGVAFAATVLLLLFGFAVSMALLAGRLAEERDRATREATTAQAVTDFLIELFDEADPTNSRGNEVSAREVLEAGSQRLRTELRDEPLTRGALLQAVGRVYTVLGLLEDAAPLLEDAERTLREAGADSLTRADALQSLATLRAQMGQEESAEAMTQEAIELRQEAGDAESSDLAEAFNILGNIRLNQSRFDEAETAHTTALDLRRELHGAQHESVAGSLHNLGNVAFLSGDSAKAAEFYRHSIAIEEADGESFDLATTLHTLALATHDLGDPGQALALEERSLAMRERILGPDHWHVALSLTTKGNLLRDLERTEESIAPLQRALRIGESSLGEEHGEVQWMRNSLARAHLDLGQFADAERLLQQTLAQGDDPATLNTLAALYLQIERAGEAEESYRRSLRLDEEELGTEHPFLISALQGLARAHLAQNQRPEAIAQLERAFAIARENYEADHPDLIDLQQELQRVRAKQ